MDDNGVLLKLNDHDHQIKDLEGRVESLQNLQNDTHSLALSVQKLADNMHHMIEEQKEIKERLDKVEREPAENAKWIRRTILTAIISTIVSAVAGLVIGLLI